MIPRSPFARAAAALGIFLALTGLLFGLAPVQAYPWVKALHVIAVIAWMAGMLYLPRLLVYHAEAGPKGERAELLKVMERRLLRAIINPAMIVTWTLGVWLAWTGFGFAGGWLLVKILAVLGLSGLHGYFSRAVRIYDSGLPAWSPMHWRIVNETVTLLMIAIVVLVIVKPF